MRTKEEWDRRWKKDFRKGFFTPRLIDDLEKLCSPKADKQVYRLMKHIYKRRGKSIYIFGPAGSGKTFLATMLIENMRREWYANDPPSLSKGESAWGYFVTVADLLTELRNTFTFARGYTPKRNQEEQPSQQTEMEVINKYKNARYLVLDDLGAEKTTDWTFQSLYAIINYRYEYLKSTIITSNFDIDALAEKLGDDRIPSRIYSMCYLYEMENEDRRLK